MDGSDLCGILEKAGITIERHTSHFHAEEDDDMWITSVANQSWAILTSDQNVERHHLDSIIQGKAKVVILIGKQSGALQWAAAVIVSQEKIFRVLQNRDGPFTMRIGSDGTITKIRDEAELLSRHKKAETAKIVRAKRHGDTRAAKP